MPILESPVNIQKFPVTHDFWIDETNNPKYKDFYTIFGNHHPGVDFALPEGTPIKSSLSGIVVRKENHTGMGNTLAIRTGNIYVLYAHLSQILVDLGQSVNQKQLVAYSGNTGKATNAPHLHFELRDLSKKTLQESVFKPEFGIEVPNIQEIFNYQVNNSNTQKTLVFLSIRYFGSPTYASTIRSSNPHLSQTTFDEILPDGTTVIIPSAK